MASPDDPVVDPPHIAAAVTPAAPPPAAPVAQDPGRRDAMYRTLVENLQGAVYRCQVNPPWRVDHMSDGVAIVTGRPAEAFTSGRITWANLTHPEDLPLVERAVEQGVADHRPFTVDYRIIHADGTIRFVHVSGQAIFDEQGHATHLEGVVLDVTGRRRAEQALRDSEHRYRSLFEHMPHGVVYQDASGAITAANPASLSTLGLTPDEVQGRTSADPRWHSIHEDGSPFSGEDHPNMVALRTGTPVRNVIMGLTNNVDQQQRWLLIDAMPEFEPGTTTPVRAFATFKDITERWRSERILEARSRLLEFAPTHSLTELLRATLDEAETLTGSQIGFFHFVEADERTLSLQTWSTRTVETFCKAEGEGLHYQIEQAGVWTDSLWARRPIIHDDYASLPHKRGMPPGHAEVVREMVVPVFRAGHIVALLGVGNKAAAYNQQDVDTVTRLADLAWDITERKRADQALKKSEARYRMISENTGDVIWVLDLASRQFKYISPSIVRLLGYTPEEVMARSMADLVTPGSKAFVDDGIAQRIAAADAGDPLARVQTHELQQTCKDGRVIDVEIVTSLLYDDHGRANEVLGVTRDITLRKRLEAQFLQAQKLEAVGQLAGGIAHDFNNILAAMLMQLDLLLDAPDLEPRMVPELEELQSSAQRAAALTRQLLLFSRRQAMQTTRVDLNDVIGGLLTMVCRLLGEHIETRFSPGAPSMWLDADTGMLKQLLMNLCVNARDAMPKGGRLAITTRVEVVEPTDAWHHQDARAGEFVCLTVTDTGCGMDDPTMKRMFEPFFTTKEPGKGTGLGLATVYGIVRQHQGWVTVESALGKGTTFRIFLPRTLEPEETFGPGRTAEPRGGHELILLVEDDAVVRHAGAAGLRRAGYRVLEAANGVEALRAWEQHSGRVDLLFTDMVMPEGMSGLELAERLQDLNPHLKVIVSSGYSAELAYHGRELLGRMAFLPKPWQLPDLLTAVRDALDGAL